tara:strand:- start:120 stop:887 length:768 start_codon:yes stop_codon:yes gene_type:complete
MHQPQGPLKYSFADYLSGKGDKKYNAQIWSALKELGVNVPEDKDGDGKITEKDFATPENGIAMIKRLTQIDEDGFDLAGTKNVVSEFLADHVGKKEFDDNRSVIETPKKLSVADQMKMRAQTLDEQEFLFKQQKEQQTQADAQNIVYSIENEFSAGETTIGTGSRYAQKSEDTTEVIDGVEMVVPGGWSLYENDKLIKNIPLNSADILDEITKHITDTAGKYGTFQIGVSEKEITKDGVTTKYVYAGNGKWSPKK